MVAATAGERASGRQAWSLLRSSSRVLAAGGPYAELFRLQAAAYQKLLRSAQQSVVL
jgi:hypothetical protein